MITRVLLILSTLVVGAMADDDDKPVIPNGEVNSKFIKQGDGEVYAQTVKEYMDKFYGKTEVLALLIKDILVAVTNRGEANTITKEIELDKKYIDLAIILKKNIGEFKSNIKGTKFKRVNNQTIIHIPTKNIDKKVIISDKDGNTLIEYTINKE